MRLSQFAPLTLALAALAGCTCADTVRQDRFACTDTSECLPGFSCRGGECRSQDIPAGSCSPGDTQPCAQGGCASACGSDGGWLECLPADGGGFESNPGNCGACGRQCSGRLGDALGCVAGRCTCVTDFDCPSGDVCGPGGLCVMNGDPCAKVACAAGEVCRDGSCAPVACALGCRAGEVCDDGTGFCRRIFPCRRAVACDDGGVCEGPPLPDGEACDDDEACTAGDVCASGACRGTSYSCPAPTTCQQSVACAGDGGCVAVPVTDGTSCDDGQACTFGDSCQAGACTGTSYTCTPDVCSETSVCAGDGGCLTTPRNVGAACDDQQACSFGDVCNAAGRCEGTAYTCPGMTACKQAGVCLGDGGCDVVDKPNGTSCDDGQDCTLNDSCASGVCVGTPVVSFKDTDGDGKGDPTNTLQLCPVSSGYVLDGGDCDDANAFVQELMPAAPDLDQDGVTGTTTLSPACVGASTTVSGRIYYRGDAGTYPWLAAASALADCNDTDGDVFRSVPLLVLDADRDGYTTGAVVTTCVGASMTFNGRTYYANAAGAFVYVEQSAAVGTNDCNDGDAQVFVTRQVARDADRDGLTTTTTLAPQCTGASSVINTRTYFADTSGAFTWLGTASAVTDCNDANAAVTGQVSYWADGDGDGFGGGAPSLRCAPLAGEVTNGTDCNDADGDVHTTRQVAADADRDGFTTTLTLAAQCTGGSSVFSGRTYFADVNGAFTWYGSTSNPVDCDDANANIFPRTVYADGDGDGFGAGAGTTQCPTQAGFVPNASDCNDSTANVYRTIASLFDDGDQDGYSNATAGSFCVGASTTVSGRTYYRNAAGAFVYTPTNLGADCNTSNGALFVTINNVVPDNDRDGYPSTTSDQSGVCAGASSTVGGRTYYASGTGGFWMSRTDCIQRQGNNCDPSFVDCYDQNAQANFTQTLFFTAHRGDGSFDYDCNGSVTANATGSQVCSSVSAGVTTYTDGTCATTLGTATVCQSPTAYSVPSACGRALVGGSTVFTNAGVCAAQPVAGTTVGCR